MNANEYQHGVIEAQSDIAEGRCRLFWQTRGAWGDRFTDLMRVRFAVQVVHTSDLTSESKQSYEEGYNGVVTSHLDQTFGIGAFERTWGEVEEYRQERHRAWVASQREV